VPDTELRPYIAMSRLAHSPVMPSWPHLVMSAAPPHLRPTDIAASISSMLRPLIGLSLLT
jgi:hypothetical protein